MAITMRHGPYNKFDPQKLRTGEIAVVTEGDPHASDGRAVYVCFSPGDVKRMATYEDMVENVDASCKEVIDRHIDERPVRHWKPVKKLQKRRRMRQKERSLQNLMLSLRQQMHRMRQEQPMRQRKRLLKL